MEVRRPYIKILYNGKNITEDVSKFLLSLTYTDKEHGESDDIELEFEDVDGLWRGPWYPEKGGQLDVTIGYVDQTLHCGIFDIDEIELSGPPDVVKVKGIAAGIAQALRTKRSKAHEKKTLREIANTIASDHGFSVTGTIPDVRFDRITHHKETDLSFLRRISMDYGCVFSIRNKQMIFSTFDSLEDRSASAEIDRLDLAQYSFKDKTTGTFKDAKVSYHNPKEKKVVTTLYATKQEQNADGYAYSQIGSPDTKTVYTKAENKQQAELKAKAHLHKQNSNQQEGSISIEGNPVIVAGNNFTITGMGKLSGIWHIKSSKHAISRSEGYTTEAEIKRVKTKGSQASTQRAKAKLTAQRQPSAVSVETKTNVDNYTYTQIRTP